MRAPESQGNGRNGNTGAMGKLSDADIVEIRQRRAAGEEAKALATEYGVSPNYIRGICRNRYRKGAGGPVVTPVPHQRLTDEQVREIRLAYTSSEAGDKAKTLAAEYGVLPNYIRAVCRNRDRKGAGGPVVTPLRHQKLTDEQVREIRVAYASSEASDKARTLAAEYGVSPIYIRRLCCHRCRKGAGGPVAKPASRKLTDEQVREIRVAHAGGKSNAAIAREYPISAGYVSVLVRGKCRKGAGAPR